MGRTNNDYEGLFDTSAHGITVDLASNGNIGYSEPVPREGDVRYRKDRGTMQVYSEAGDGWSDVSMPISENNGYDEIKIFLEKLTVQQLQDVYKNKGDLLITIEKLLLGQI